MWIHVDVFWYEPQVPPPPPYNETVTLTNGAVPLFVYGTLTYCPIRFLVYGECGESTAAKLPGYAQAGLDLRLDANATTTGELLWVKPDELKRIDRYEDAGTSYFRIPVTLDSGLTAWTYTKHNY